MRRVEWDGSLETGHRLVDDQHRELIAVFNELADHAIPGCDEERTSHLLVRLSDYVSTHFSDEEALMRRYSYPDEHAAAHRAQHEDLSSRTRELVLAHRSGETATALRLVSLLQEWLTVHIAETDSEFVGYVRSLQADEAC